MTLAGCAGERSNTSGDQDGAATQGPAAHGLIADPGPGHLTPAIINGDPALSGLTLRRPSISPDGTRVTYLQGRADDARQQDLWVIDLASGERQRLVSSTDILGAPETLSEEEKNRRERAREYGYGIIDYKWTGPEQILFPLGGDIYLYDLKNRQSERVTNSPEYETDPKVSQSGRYVAYVRADNLYVTELQTGQTRALTSGASQTVRNGTASFVVQEELDRQTGYWWSPDEAQLAYTQIDESPVAIESRLDFGADGIQSISQRYPFAGTANVTVRLGIVARSGGKTLWTDIGADKDIYLTRVLWSKDGRALYAGILSRDNKSHKILKIDPNSGTSKVIYEDTSSNWLNISTDFKALKSGELLWAAERSDMQQIFIIDPNGAPGTNFKAVTPDNVLVQNLSCVDEQAGQIFFTGWKDNPLERHIFKIDLDGQNLKRLSSGEGRHNASFSKNCARYIGTFENPSTPPQSRAFDRQGNAGVWLSENKLDETHPFAPYLNAYIAPQYGELLTDDGTRLYYSLYKPADLKPGERRPSVTLVYGGPHAQRVHKGWQSLMGQMLAQHGFVVFQLDNRGSGNRGKSFEAPLYHAMAKVEVRDQSLGANWLKSQDFIDPERMGVYGWSYGGYMTLHMLAQTDHYRAGVAGAPVTDWTLYDTAYTERYLGSPKAGDANNEAGVYEAASVFPYLDGLTEKMLLIHGMADDNVVFRHSIMFMDALQQRQADNFRVMTYPGEKHGFRRKSNRIHRDQMILDFFLETLGQ